MPNGVWRGHDKRLPLVALRRTHPMLLSTVPESTFYSHEFLSLAAIAAGPVVIYPILHSCLQQRQR